MTGYVGCDQVLAVLCLSLGVGLGGLGMAGYNVNHLDLAPPFAGMRACVCVCWGLCVLGVVHCGGGGSGVCVFGGCVC